MKKLLLIATPLLLSISSAFSQERPRNFDNFDSQRGVQVFCPPSPSKASKHTDADDDSDERVVSRYAAPPSRNKLVKKTAMVSMTVYDGFAQREALARSEAPAPYETAHLTMTAGKLLKGYSTGSPLIDSYIVDSS